MRAEQSRTRWLPLGLLVAAACALHAAVGLRQWANFRIGSWDLLLFDEAVRAYAHVRAPIEPALGVHIGVGPHLNALGDHFSPILALLAPLYWIWPDPRSLILAQAALIGISLPAVFLISERILGRGAAYAVVVVTALAWPLQQSSETGFHEVLFVVPIMCWALERLQVRAFGQAVAIASLLLLVKEDMGFVLAMFGLLVWRRGGRRLGWLTFASGVVFAALASQVIVPAFYGHGSPDGDYYKAFIDAAPNPIEMVRVAVTPLQKTQTLLWLLAPLAMLSLGSPVVLLALPQVGERFISANANHWGLEQHYNAVLVPMVVVAAVETAGRLPASWRRAWAWAAAGVAVVLCTRFPIDGLLRTDTWQSDARETNAQQAVDAVPHRVTVEADNEIGPHLARHDLVLLLDRTPRSAPWVVVDIGVASFPIDSLQAQRDRLTTLQSQGYVPVLRNSDYVVLRRP